MGMARAWTQSRGAAGLAKRAPSRAAGGRGSSAAGAGAGPAPGELRRAGGDRASRHVVRPGFRPGRRKRTRLQEPGLPPAYRLAALDPRSEYPLFLAARVYAEVPDEARSRIALEFVYQEFFKDPNRRWPWLAHAAVLAKHRLGDLALARRYAAAIDHYTTSEDVPLWAKQMEIFILEDLNELEAAKI